MDSHKNFVYTAVATAPSPASSGTSLVVTAGAGATFPAAPFNVTVWPSGAQPLASNAEIVRVTAIATDTLTIVRAQEGTSARSILVGDQLALTITAKAFTDIEAQLAVKAWVNFDGATAANVSGTYSRTSPSTTLTITLAGHGCIVGNVIRADFTTGTGLDGTYTVDSVIDGNTFTITTAASTTTSGNVTLLRRLIRASSGVSSVTYLNTAGSYHVNFATPFADANYSVGGLISGAASAINNMTGGVTPTPEAYNLRCVVNGALANASIITAQFMR